MIKEKIYKKMLASPCCKSFVTVGGKTTHYYVCGICGEAVDAITVKKLIKSK